MKSNKMMIGLIAFIFVLLLAPIAMLLVFKGEEFYVALPMLAAIFSYICFCVLLQKKVGAGILGEIGFVYMSFVMAYTILPAIGFLVLKFSFPDGFDGLNFSVLVPSPKELGVHLWRHVLFLISTMLGYLIVRNRITLSASENIFIKNSSAKILIILIITVSSMIGIEYLSGPVEEYFDHYTRFDHLSEPLKKLAMLFMLLKGGAYYLVFSILFINYRKNRWLIFISTIFFVSFEIYYSLGSRIAALNIFLAVISLIHVRVKKISFRIAALYFSALAVLFTVVESVRSANYDASAALEEMSGKEVKIAMEFGAVFYTSFHIYSEREAKSLPEPDTLMLFGDIIDFIPFVDHTKYNSQYWYAREYFPNSIVPPQTMGPIADSGIWGGEIDLLFRGLATGLFYGVLVNWIALRINSLYSLLIYSFAFSNCVMSLKYSFIHQTAEMIKILLPIVGVYWLLDVLLRKVNLRSNSVATIVN